MRILFCQWDSICEEDMEQALRALQIDVLVWKHEISHVDYDTEYMNILIQRVLEESVDYVFSVNFVPIIARACQILRVRYISWTVDSPLFQLNSAVLSSPYNRIFLFDYRMYEQYYPKAPANIYYLPLAGNPDKYDAIIDTMTTEEAERYSHDVCFVGSLYTEKCPYNQIKNIPPHLDGYVHGMIMAQHMVGSTNILYESMSKECKEFFDKIVAEENLGTDYDVDYKEVTANHYLGIKCSEVERKRFLFLLSQEFDTYLYTLSDTREIPNVHNMGVADSRTMMPKIFRQSRINLNMTARTIRTGLSQRVFDVMAAGGFLLTNRQLEVTEYFQDGVELATFDTEEELMEKVRYYLEHEEERQAVARAGYEAVRREHTFVTRFRQMFGMLGEECQ